MNLSLYMLKEIFFIANKNLNGKVELKVWTNAA